MIRPHGLIEMVRTGEIAIARGSRLRALARRACATLDSRRARRRGAPRARTPGQRHGPRSSCDRPLRRSSSPRASPRDRWFCWEQPDRGLRPGGARRRPRGDLAGRRRASRDVAARVPRAVADDAVVEEPAGLPAGAGPVWAGGFAFDPDGGASPHLVLAAAGARWSCRRSRSAAAAARAFLTVNAVVRPGRGRRRRCRRARGAGWPACATAPLPMLDPHPTVAGGDPQRPPARATSKRSVGGGDRADRGRRDRQGRARPRGGRRARRPPTTRRRSSAPCASSSRPASASAAGRPRPPSSAPAPSCSCAAPGASVSTVALAGSTRRSADPAVDDHLGEQLLRSDKDRREQRIVVRADRAHPAPALGLGRGRAPSPR